MENNVLQQLKENIAKVMIGNEVYDAVSDTGAFIERGKVVRVVKYQAGQVYVVMS
jgi:membrane-bound serine protease (ClpP class)